MTAHDPDPSGIHGLTMLSARTHARASRPRTLRPPRCARSIHLSHTHSDITARAPHEHARGAPLKLSIAHIVASPQATRRPAARPLPSITETSQRTQPSERDRARGQPMLSARPAANREATREHTSEPPPRPPPPHLGLAPPLRQAAERKRLMRTPYARTHACRASLASRASRSQTGATCAARSPPGGARARARPGAPPSSAAAAARCRAASASAASASASCRGRRRRRADA